MEGDELQRIRAARLAELQAQHGGANGRSPSANGGISGSGAGGGGAAAQNDGVSAEERREAEDAQRHALLSQILDASARDRLRRIALVKADRARAIEDLVVGMARRGQIRGRVTEPELVGLLEEIAGREQESDAQTGKGKITFQRRRDSFDDEWD